MRKLGKTGILVALSSTAISLALGYVGCATVKHDALETRESALPFPLAAKQDRLDKVWEKKFDGRMTDMIASQDGTSVLVALAPEEGGAQENQLVLLDDSGDVVWRLAQSAPIRSLAVTRDGQTFFVGNYSEELIALDRTSRGKARWTAQGTGMCRAIPLDAQKKILCYHDDDARPGVAFDVFDWEGKNIFSFPVQGDVLSLKVSSDQTRILLGLTQGRVILLDVNDEFKKIWEAKLDGEIVDFAISESDPGKKSERIVVLATGKKGQWVHTLDHDGKLTRKVRSPAAWDQVEITPDGTRISGYGNGPSGQSLWMLNSEDLKEQWQRSDPRYADYSSTMTSFNDMTLIGFEEVSPKTRYSHLLAFNPSGEIRWNLPLITEEGAYLYARAFSPSTSLLVVGTDDAVLSGYRIKQGTQN